MMEIERQGETLSLWPQRAIYWRRRQALIVADTHFGKAATFRHAGIPVPSGSTAADLARLDHLLDVTGAQRLIVLGDFFHARRGRAAGTMAALAAWRERRRALAIELVPGNHDRAAGNPPEEWRISISIGALIDFPFVFCHEPPDEAANASQACASDSEGALYTLSGHVHPAIRLHDPCGPSLKASCFWFRPRHAVLPAFGSFTGTHCIAPEPFDRLFAVGPDAVLEIPTARPAQRQPARRARKS